MNNFLTEALNYEWDGTNWVNDWKDIFSYDVNNNMIERLKQSWDSSNWMNDWKYICIYDANSNEIERLWQNWDGTNWVNSNKYLYSYGPTGIEQLEDGVSTYSLSNNYPNPFNPSTIISYSVPDISFIKLKVYDVLGNEIETLVHEEKPAGTYEITWYAEYLPSGVYFYKLQAGDFVETKKMVLMK